MAIKNTTQYIYDQAGRLLQTIDGRGTATSLVGDYVTHYAYDGLGRQTDHIEATDDGTAGHHTETVYQDELDIRLTSSVITTLANNLTTTSSYNKNGQLIDVVKSDLVISDLGTTRYYYDAEGKLRYSVDPTDVATHHIYDAADRMVATIDGNGSVTETVYDNNGNVIRTIQYATPLIDTQLSSLINTADSLPAEILLSNIRPIQAPEDRNNYYIYNNANQLIYSIDAEGYVVESRYDGAGQVTDSIAYANTIDLELLPTIITANVVETLLIGKIDENDDRHTRNYFDADGNLIGVLDAEGYLISYKYNNANQLVESIQHANPVRLQGWGNPRPLGALQLGPAYLPQIKSAADGDIIAVWREYDGTNYSIFANRFDATQNAWDNEANTP